MLNLELVMLKETAIWLDLAKEHFKDAKLLYEHRHFSGCVYFCHQTLEKVLKACIVEFAHIIPPKHHDLDRLAEATKIKISKQRIVELKELTKHFWKVRYPDYRKRMFNNIKITKQDYELSKEVFIWLKEKLSQA